MNLIRTQSWKNNGISFEIFCRNPGKHRKKVSKYIACLLRLLHETLIICNEGGIAAKTMYELLSSFTGEKANEARDDSIRCVAAELKNPSVYLFDHLINLKPVEQLKGSEIYELLDIFVHKDLAAYQKFESQNQEYLKQNGFDLEDLLRKIRLLTFASIGSFEIDLRM